MTIQQVQNELRKHTIQLALEVAGLACAVAVLLAVFGLVGCQTAGCPDTSKTVVVAVNSVVGFGCNTTGQIVSASCDSSNNNGRIQVLVSFKDPQTSTSTQDLHPDTSVPISLTK